MTTKRKGVKVKSAQFTKLTPYQGATIAVAKASNDPGLFAALNILATAVARNRAAAEDVNNLITCGRSEGADVEGPDEGSMPHSSSPAKRLMQFVRELEDATEQLSMLRAELERT